MGADERGQEKAVRAVQFDTASIPAFAIQFMLLA
jgi:hypothetical protein